MPSTFSFPTTTIFAVGARRELTGWLAKLGCARPLIVTDASVVTTKAFELLMGSLDGTKPAVFSDVRPNPEEADVEGAAQAYREKSCDAVIAFGGGSPMDVGKAIRLRLKRPDKTLAQFEFAADWSGLEPLIAIPTTAGTGSEVGRSSVIIMEHRKHVIFHPALLASLVILDPEFTRDLPPKLTAATGADALTHCIESFTSPVFHPLCDGIALEGIHLISSALPRAVKDGGDLEARGLMQVAAAMGGIAFQKDLGATHSLAHPLSSLCGLHHGLANALCLPFVMDFNAERKPGVYRRVGIALGGSNPTDADTIATVRALLAEIGLTPGLRAHGVDETKLDPLADQAFADGCHATNPVPVTREDLHSLYHRAL
jgi:alcohol dehydrogenase class IV